MPAYLLLALWSAALLTPSPGDRLAPDPDPLLPDREYHVWVASEATDRVHLVRWGPEGAELVRTVSVSVLPTEADGPHGLAISPDGEHLFVTTAHGRPYGHIAKYEAATGRRLGRVMLGHFPASLEVTPDGEYAFVVNFNLHGDMVPSSVSVVGLRDMVEVARLETCTMPHGSRISPDGRLHYSTCMMDDMLVEVDAWGLEVARHFLLTQGAEHGGRGKPDHGHHGGHPVPGAQGAGGTHEARESHGPGAHEGMGQAEGPLCSPTWAQPSHDGMSVFVACNASNEVVEVDVASWSLSRRLPAGEGVYNLAVTGDGRLLVATNKLGRSVSIFDLASGEETARIPTQRPVVHGVVISPDDRYAFISVEGIGSEPGTLEILDLERMEMAARVDVGQMAAGVVFWR
jgi:DNA-binding beta-propeller fold protein YncE